MKASSSSASFSLSFHLCLLILWMVIGTTLRFANLAAKPPWADEWATLVFSLGHSFKTIALDQIIALDTLLQPVQVDYGTQPRDVVSNLMRESTHPPIYFVLTHWWLKLFSGGEGLVSLWWARCLSALLGVISIPAIFGLAYLSSRSFLTAQLAAVLMTVSPYGVYLAQETRHYTLAILWIMASFACLLVTIKHLQKNISPPYWIIGLWIIVNSLAVATHYFVSLALVAETIVLIGFWWQQNRESSAPNSRSSLFWTKPWRRVTTAIIGTIAGCSVWLLAWQTIPGDRLTDWVEQNNGGIEFFAPLGRLIAWLVTMLFLLPIEGVSNSIIVISSLILLLTLTGLVLIVWQQRRQQAKFIEQIIINRFLLISILLVLSCAYLYGRDLTLAARFQFFYFPAVLLAIAYTFTRLLVQPHKNSFILNNRYGIVVALIISFGGALTVINNFGYQKPDQPNLVAPVIQEAQQLNPEIPVLIATVHKTHEQTGEMMGIAWEWQKMVTQRDRDPQFLLLHKEQEVEIVTKNLHRQVNQLPRPLDVWVVNFSAPAVLESQNCHIDPNFKRRIPGYRYRLYHCL